MTEAEVKELLELLRARNVGKFLETASSLEAADLADVLREAEDAERVEIVKLLPPSLSGAALSELPDQEHAGETVAALEPEYVAEIVEELPDDDAADLLGELPPETQELILSKIEDLQQREEVADLLKYHPETAGGLMTASVMTVSEGQTVGNAIEQIRHKAEGVGDFSEAYVVDDRGRLKGVIGFKKLVVAAPDRQLAEVIDELDVTVPPDMDQEEVAHLMARYNVSTIPVVDSQSRLLGQITFDDVTDVLEAEATEDLLKFGGVSGDEDLGAGWREAVRSRLPWLIVNLGTAMMAAMVPKGFRGTITDFAFVAAYMTVVSGMGGNTGTQALAVNVRRLALRLIDLREFWLVIRKEVLVGAINGLVTGIIAGTVAWVIEGQWIFGLVVFVAMVGNMAVAGFAGAFIPMLMKRMRVDPALASSVFVTAFTDTCGFLFLLSLAALLLR